MSELTDRLGLTGEPRQRVDKAWDEMGQILGLEPRSKALEHFRALMIRHSRQVDNSLPPGVTWMQFPDGEFELIGGFAPLVTVESTTVALNARWSADYRESIAQRYIQDSRVQVVDYASTLTDKSGAHFVKVRVRVETRDWWSKDEATLRKVDAWAWRPWREALGLPQDVWPVVKDLILENSAAVQENGLPPPFDDTHEGLPSDLPPDLTLNARLRAEFDFGRQSKHRFLFLLGAHVRCARIQHQPMDTAWVSGWCPVKPP